ncbi:MAG: cupin domain-containing protein, partial [Stellaceae bacterium]
MAGFPEANYPLARRETLAQNDELKLSVLTLAAGQEVPWHWHTTVSDQILCIEGPMVVETRAPSARFELQPGESCSVPAKRAHRVRGKDGGGCRFANLQGVGRYDFNPVGG